MSAEDLHGKVSRFELLEVHGEQGGAVLWVANDPELGRQVLLLVSPLDRAPRADGAVARLTHPNVLAVHERGDFESGTYVALEHAPGVSLERWLIAEPRTPGAVIDVLIGAGRGLSAIHAAGGAVGGFAAASVLVDDDGRGRIVPIARDPADPAADVCGFGQVATAAIAAAGDVTTLRRLRAAMSPPPASIDAMIATLEALVAPPLPARRWPYLVVALGLGAVGIAITILATRTGGGRRAAAVPAPAPDRAPVVLADLGGCATGPTFVGDRTVVFSHTGGRVNGVLVVELAGGEPRVLLDRPAGAVGLAHGDRPGTVLFLSDGIKRLDLDGTLEEVEQRFNYFVSSSVLGVDGTLLFVAGSGEALHRLRGARDEVVVTLPAGVLAYYQMLSPDHRWVTLTTPKGLYLVDLATAGAPPVKLDNAELAYQRAPMSADAAAIYYPASAGMRRFERATGRDQVVVPGAGGDGGLALSPDGMTLVWSDCQSISTFTDVTDPAAPRVLFDEAVSLPDVMPDGSWLYSLETPSTSLAARRRPDGTVVVLSTPELGYAGGPSASPDGTRVAFPVDGVPGGIYVSSAEGGGTARRVGDGTRTVRWLPDGRLVWDALDEHGIAHVVVATIGDDGPVAAPELLHPAPHRLVAVLPTTGEVLLTDANNSGLSLFDPRTGAERVIPIDELRGSALFSVRVAPDGSFALIVPATWDAIWRVPLDGKGPVTKIAVGTFGRFTGAVVMPDGRIVIAEGARRGRLYRAAVGP